MKNQKGNILLVILVIVAMVVGVVWYLKKGTNLPEEIVEIPSYQSGSDLDGAVEELDSADLDQVDSEVKGISDEASNF